MRVRERLASSCQRSFQLPTEVDVDHLRAPYDKRILTLHVPKTAKQDTVKVPATSV